MKLVFEVHTTDAFWDPPERGLEVIRNAIDAAAPERSGAQRAWYVTSASWGGADPAERMVKAFEDKLYHDASFAISVHNVAHSQNERDAR